MTYETPKNENEVEALEAIRKLTKALAEESSNNHVTGDDDLNGTTFAVYCYVCGIRVKAQPSHAPDTPMDDTGYLAEISARAYERAEEREADPSPEVLYVGAMPWGSVETPGEGEPYARAWKVPFPSVDEGEKDHGPTPFDMLNDLKSGRTPKSMMTSDAKMERVGSYTLKGLSTHHIALLMDYSEGHVRRLRRGWRKKVGAEYLEAADEGRIGLLVEVYERAARVILEAMDSEELSPLQKAELAQAYMRLALDFSKFLGK